MTDEPRSLVTGRPLPEQLDWRLRYALDEAQHHQPQGDDLEPAASPGRPAVMVAMAGVLRLVGSAALRLANGLDGRTEASRGLPEQRWPY
jgi:hypothetical protein